MRSYSLSLADLIRMFYVISSVFPATPRQHFNVPSYVGLEAMEWKIPRFSSPSI